MRPIYIGWVVSKLVEIDEDWCFTLKKARSRRYPTETIMDADYADDIVLLANTLTQAKSLLHSLEQATGGIGLHVNADKIKNMVF